MLSRLGAPQLLLASSLLASFGLVMVYSASAIQSELAFGSPSIYLWRQLGGLGAGVLLAVMLAHAPLGLLQRVAFPFLVLCSVALAATLTPLGASHKGAARWLSIGGVAFQPLEPTKLALVLALARWLAGAQDRLGDFRASLVVPAGLAAVPVGLLLLQPDFGGAMLLVLFTGAMTFVAGARVRHLAAAAALAAPLAALVAVAAPYRLGRLQGFLDPWRDPLGQGYQLVQSLIAFGAGGIAGTGLGSGQQKLGYLPEAHTDFILSVVGEELGLVGVCAVLACFAVMGLAAIGIASRGRDAFALLVAFGASLLLWLQGLINAAVAMALLPTKGTTLPLFSYGRSSLVVSLAAIGLVLNVARPSKRRRSGWR